MPNYNLMLAGIRELVNNPNPRAPTALCLDTSYSMLGRPIQELNAGIVQYQTEMRSNSVTLSSIETAVVTFADKATCAADFATPDRMQVAELKACGMTDMGAGLTMALDLLEQRKKQYQMGGVDYYQPILVVMSDGKPNGDPRQLNAAVERIRQQAMNRKLTVVAVGIGEEADMDVLARVSPCQRPVHLNGLQFREFFAWLSKSMTIIADSTPGDEPELDMESLRALEAEPWPNKGL